MQLRDNNAPVLLLSLAAHSNHHGHAISSVFIINDLSFTRQQAKKKNLAQINTMCSREVVVALPVCFLLATVPPKTRSIPGRVCNVSVGCTEKAGGGLQVAWQAGVSDIRTFGGGGGA